MFQALRPAVAILAIMTVVTGIIYPLTVTAFAQLVMPSQAGGSLIERDGKIVGSALIGQSFTRPEYFWGRPSATAPLPYNAAASGGSNLGPLHPDLTKAVQARVEAVRKYDPSVKLVPVDLATSSGSGLDPHISPSAAETQVRRVALARHLDEAEVRRLVELHTAGRQFGILGEPRVNVLELNLALDERSQASAAKMEPRP